MHTFSILKKALMAIALIAPNLLFAQEKINYLRSYDQRGINQFESPKNDTSSFDKVKVKIGAAFTQQFQDLHHNNEALLVKDASGNNVNQLMDIGPGFNLATANLNIDAQLADGVRLNVVTYLSARHHNETWVKGGYLQMDKLPFLHSETADQLMKYITIKAGDFELNYGDAHFRRTDNGNAIYNPFVGNYILDAFMTGISGELYFKDNGWLGMVGLAGSQINSSVTNPSSRGPAIYGKLSYDRQVNHNLRLRLTGSLYNNHKSPGNSLYHGDRGGSRYYMVMENTEATTDAQAWSGEINPGFSTNVTSYMINPFVKYKGLAFFGTYEHGSGRKPTETANRTVQQYAGDLLYYLGKNENFYIGARYDYVRGRLAGLAGKISVAKVQASAGWFITKNILLKGEYVNQQYYDFPDNNILYKGHFHGIIAEGVVAF